PAAGADVETLHLLAVDLADAWHEAEVVNIGDRAVLVGGGESDLELARQQLADLVAHEIAHKGADVRRAVEQLALAHPGPWVAGHVADGVPARLATRQADLADHADR